MADAAGGLVEKVEGEFEFVVHGGSPFRVVSGAPVSAVGCGPGLGGAVNPGEPGVGGGGFSARLAGAKRLEASSHRAENSHSARGHPARAWVERDGPRPSRLGPR